MFTTKPKSKSPSRNENVLGTKFQNWLHDKETQDALFSFKQNPLDLNSPKSPQGLSRISCNMATPTPP